MLPIGSAKKAARCKAARATGRVVASTTAKTSFGSPRPAHKINEEEETVKIATKMLTAVACRRRSDRGARRSASAQTLEKFPVPPELDAVRRARAVLRRPRQGLLQGGRARRRDPGGQRLHHGRPTGRQPDQPGRLRGCRDHDARHRRRHADQGGRRDAAAKPDVVHLPGGCSRAPPRSTRSRAAASPSRPATPASRSSPPSWASSA